MFALQSKVTEGSLPMLGVTVAKKGKIVFNASASSASESGLDVLHPEDTILRIYSMTKPITSVAALMLTGREGRPNIVQRSAKRMVHGCEKFLPALA